MLYKNFNSDIQNRIDYCCIKNTRIIYSSVINQLNYNHFINTIKAMLLNKNYIILENECYDATMEQITDTITIVKINKNDTNIKDLFKNSIHVEFKVNTVNMATEGEYPWHTFGTDSVVDKLNGYVKIVPDPTTHQGIGTVSVSIGSTIFGQVTVDGSLDFNVNVNGIEKMYSVGVTT